MQMSARRNSTLATLTLLQDMEFLGMVAIAERHPRATQTVPGPVPATPSRAIAPDVDTNPAATAAAIIAAGKKRRAESAT